MWTTLSVRIRLLTLTAVMLFSASQVDSQLHLPASCCKNVRGYKAIEDIKLCYEQKKRLDCSYHAFVIITNSGEKFCVKPTPRWLKDLRNTGKLKCPPEFSKALRQRFEVLDEDDLD